MEREDETTRIRKIWETAHQLTVKEVLEKLNVDAEVGLKGDEVKRRLLVHGRNELPRKAPRSIWFSILEQFGDTLVLILLGAAFISFLIALFGGDAEEEGMKAFIEPCVIILILVANASIGVWQELNAEKALEALMVLQAESTKVLRDGGVEKVAVSDLVPGDICLLEGGDKVPADIRALEARALQVTQAALTGESNPINKDPNKVVDISNATNQDKVNMLFSATGVTTGQVKGVVVGTGKNSELGKIQDLIEKASEDKRKTPLKENLEKFGTTLSYIVAVICVLSWAINIPKFSDPGHGTWYKAALYYFKISVSLAVAAIPEGLPAVITTCLALATRRMADIQAIIRHLSSVETLGCTTVICSDKTGTLTLNNMTVIEFTHFDSRFVPIQSDIEAVKDVKMSAMDNKKFAEIDAVKRVSEVAALCSDAHIKYDDPREHSKLIFVGTPTEVALREFARKLGHFSSVKPEADNYEYYSASVEKRIPNVTKLPFTRDRKCMSVIVNQDGKNVLMLKGAAEVVLEKRCSSIMTSDNKVVPLTEEIKKEIAAKIHQSTCKGLRCIALAIRQDLLAKSDEDWKALSADVERYGEVECNCTFLGYVGIQDPPRPEVKPAIAKCKEAGIRVIMITGDNIDTAGAIAKKLNLVEATENVEELSIEGRKFDEAIGKEKKLDILRRGVKVFARVEPRHKIELVTYLQQDFGEVVAMTGDGVNDAPALKKADIGIAMGIAGSDVAKEASKMVLADDNFATIVNAIEEGRAIYSNIKSFIRYLISSNIGEVVAIFIGSILGIPEVLTSVQLLWMNLVTDGLPAIALGFNPPDLGLMLLKPRRKDEPIIGGWSLTRYLIIGTYIGIASVAVYVHWYVSMITEDGHKLVSFSMLRDWSKCSTWSAANQKLATVNKPCDVFVLGGPKATTMSLTVLVMLEMFGAINAVSDSQSLLVSPPWKNPWLCGAVATSLGLHALIVYTPGLKGIFGVSPLSCTEWMWVMIYSLPVIVIEEVIKFFGRARAVKEAPAIAKEKSE